MKPVLKTPSSEELCRKIDPNMAMAASNEKRAVPWYSMKEWREVYSLVYAENPEDQKVAVSRMLLWKTRVPKLPAGAECTLYLLQAVTRDGELTEKSRDTDVLLTEQDLRLIYCTAIIRFVNLISHLGQVAVRHQPIQAVAENFGIPDWLVMIRHEATHSKFPALGILKPAARVALQWLHENYWKQEEELSHDWLQTDETLPQQDLQTVEPDVVTPKLLEAVRDCINFMKENKKALQMSPSRVTKKNQPATRKPTVQDQLGKLLREIGNHSRSDEQTSCKSVAFSFAEILSQEKFLVKDFKPLFEFLNKINCLPFFMEELQRRMSNNEQLREASRNAVLELVDLIQSTGSSVTSEVKYDWMKIAREFLKTPDSRTWERVSKILRLQDPPVDVTLTQRLKELVQLYLGESKGPETGKTDLGKIYSLKNLPGFEEQPNDEVAGESGRDEDADEMERRVPIISTWTASDDYNWKEIPIGSLLGTKRPEMVPEMNVTWKKRRAAEMNGSVGTPKRSTSGAFDWNSLVKKRRRRGGMGKSQPTLNLV